MSLDGIIVAVCAALAGALALVNQSKWAVIPALGAIGLLIYNYMNIQNQLGGASACDRGSRRRWPPRCCR